MTFNGYSLDNRTTYNGAILRSPSDYTVTKSDVSAPDAGRSEDGVMHEMYMGRLYKFALKWANITTNEAMAIISLFAPEYISVKYYDFVTNQMRTTSFYSGDNGLQMYSAALNIVSELSLNIIERVPIY